MAVENKTIPKGYKKTEIGIIPEDWEIKKLAESIEIVGGGTPNTYNKEYWGGDIPWISVADFTNNCKWILNTEKNITQKGLNESSTKLLQSGQLIISARGTVGAIAQLKRGMAFNQSCYGLNSRRNIATNNFIFYALHYIINDVKKSTHGAVFDTITRETLNHLKIALPSLVEQTAIAAVLSDIDELIENLDKLIGKKKLIKQGAMQELLTGKRRLPGFSGDWEVKKLGEIGKISGAGVDKKINPSEESVILLNYLDVYKKDFIFSKDLNHRVTAPKIKLINCSVEKGDIFFTPSSELQTDIAYSAVAMENINNAVYSYHIIRLRIHGNWDLKYRSYAFKTKQFYNQAEKNAEGSGKRYVISLSKFKELSIFYPIELKEQTAIAAVLSDIDAEIEALERKRDKYKQIKQGAMQVLLAGKIRLI